MKYLSRTTMAAVFLGVLSSSASASALDFRFDTKWAAEGQLIVASGVIDVMHIVGPIYEITKASGYVNGSQIDGIKPKTSPTLFANASGILSGTNNTSVGFETTSGVTYEFDFGVASSSTGDVSFGKFVVSSVPLPASAPMFGAALIGFAGFGYAAKRKKAAIAVT